MAYGLPPPWDPGYALPGNVLDEGLRRRAFVTKQMPRGTYDHPAVGDGGYDVPQYVKDEGFGQGTYTTKWAPSGSYPGKAIPNWLNARPQLVADKRLPGGAQRLTIQRGLPGLGGIQSEPSLPSPFESYGQRAATALMNRMSTLPPAQRKTVLKATLDKVDPSLWRRTAEIAQRYVNQGMPPSQALHQGLARAMSTGIAAEIVNNGLRRSAPQPRSLLGLGCYGCAIALAGAPTAMGTVGVKAGGEPDPQPPAWKNPPPSSTTSVPPPPAAAPPAAPPGYIPPPPPAPAQALDMSCAPPAGFKWVAATANVPGHYERLRVGEAPQTSGVACDPTTGKTIVPVVRDHTQEDAATGVLIGPTADFKFPLYFDKNTPVNTVRDFSKIADYTIFLDDVDPAKVAALQKVKNFPHVGFARNLPTPWLSWIASDLTTPGGWKDYSFTNEPALYDPTSGSSPGVGKWYQYLKVPSGAKLYTNTHSLPQAHVSWPADGSDVGLYYQFGSLDPVQEDKDRTNPSYKYGSNPDNPVVLKLWISKIPDQSLEYEAAQFFAKFVDAVVDALKDLGNLACDLLSKPGSAQAAGAAAAGAAGLPPQAGAAGAAIAAAQCGKPPPPVAPVVAKTSSLPVAIAVGGVVLAALFFTRAPKRKQP